MRTYEETVESLNAMITEIHENAVTHGWWEEGRKAGEIYALIHSELSEALEEFRDDKPDIYCGAYGSDWCHICYGDTSVICPDVDCLECIEMGEESGKLPHKTEGVIVELADAVIRILDYCGMKRFQLEISEADVDDEKDLARLISVLHAGVSQAFLDADAAEELPDPECLYLKGEVAELSSVVKYIWHYVGILGYDLTTIIGIKHRYNKTRPYKHGGKKI